jgi:hypothetical protein
MTALNPLPPKLELQIVDASQIRLCHLSLLRTRAAWVLALALGLVGSRAAAQEARLSSKPPELAADYRDPPRAYERMPTSDGVFWVEKQLLEEDPRLAQAALDRLVHRRADALAALPAHARPGLAKVPFYLMYGPNARGGGQANGLRYIQAAAPKNHPHLDPSWGGAIVVFNAANYASITDFWSLKAVVHELAHAYQLSQWPERQPDILHAWQHAIDQGLYRNVKDVSGKTLNTGYAATNALEYFAELSCMYFMGCNYYPTTRAELARYDPEGLAMVTKLWSVSP